MKKFIVLVLAAVMVFTLASCINGNNSGTNNSTNKPSENGSAAKPASKPGSISDQHDPDGTTETDSGEFDAGMMKYIEKSEKGNYVISPVSLKLVLGML
ncbi:MAG: hypothetical protein II748_01250, partial [Clostridia bacterium]|nr:hypothetical protein [Clostridia bacterium]